MKKQRPNLVPVSAETQRLSALLAEQILSWPGVSERPMFGMRAFYRGEVVFAMLPNKRAFNSASAIMYNLPDPTQKREGPKWQFFQLEETNGLTKALTCLETAYAKARSTTKP